LRTPEIARKRFDQSLFIDTFHFTFDSSWYGDLDFRYVGIAESGTEKADVIETAFDNTTYRLFFDSKTNLLILMIRTVKTTNGKTLEFKHYYSNYKKFDGILLPTKIKVDRDGAYFSEQSLKSAKFEFKP
jgi:hypothetical protein